MSIAKRFQTALDRDEEGRLGGVLCVERRQEARCLWVFNGAGFDKEMEKFDMGALDLDGDPDADHGDQRDFFEFTVPFTLDNSGRLVIPQKFRDVVGIEDGAMAVGMNSRIEIWGAERWENRPRGSRSPGAKSSTPSAAQQSGDSASAGEDSPSKGR